MGNSSKFYHLILLDLKNLGKIISLISEKISIDQQISFSIDDLSQVLKDYQKICQLLNLSLTQIHKIKKEINHCQQKLEDLLKQYPHILKKNKSTIDSKIFQDVISSLKSNLNFNTKNKIENSHLQISSKKTEPKIGKASPVTKLS